MGEIHLDGFFDFQAMQLETDRRSKLKDGDERRNRYGTKYFFLDKKIHYCVNMKVSLSNPIIGLTFYL